MGCLGELMRTDLNQSPGPFPQGKPRAPDGSRRGKILVLAIVGGGTLLAVGATLWILATWGR